MSGHHEIEIYPDSGIAERGHMPPTWLLATFVFFFVYFTGYVAAQFWDQADDLPFYGPGWEVHDQHANFGNQGEYRDINFADASTRRVQASQAVANTTDTAEPGFRSIGGVLRSDYGMSR